MKGFVNGIDWINAEPMKYWSFAASTPIEKRKQETHNMIFSGDYLAALKVDGYYERLIKDEDGNCFMVARSKNVKGEATEKLAWVPQIHDFMKSLPNGTVLLSECYLPGNEGSQKITSLLGCLKDKCIARQNAGQKLHFYIFDVMTYANEDLTKTPLEKRILVLNHMNTLFKTDYVEWARYYEGEELWNKLQSYLAEGREGVVLMRKDAPVYFKRTPARVSLKIKKELKETIDCFFTGRALPPTKLYTGKEIETWKYWINEVTNEKLSEGEHYFEVEHDKKPYMPVTKPYYYNYAGSLEIGLVDNGKIVGIGYLSGLTDEIKANYREYKYRVIEVGAMMLTPDGALRHGKMLGWRPDKRWEECDISQLKSL